MKLLRERAGRRVSVGTTQTDREGCRRPSDPLLGIIHRQIAASHAQYTPLALRMVSNNADLTAVKAVSNSYSLI